ncbi:MAG: phage portal protein, partial [Mucinivorans sp.]
MKITELFATGRSVDEIITDLKKKSIDVPSWDTLRKEYDPMLHDVMDPVKRPNKKVKGKPDEPVSRITLKLQQLAVKRMAEFMFALPVKRIYKTEDDKVKQEIAKALEAIYTSSRIDTLNLSRARAYFASCEIATLWYVVPSKNTTYGFESQYKLRCKTYNPMDGYKLYPLFDNYGDMIAFSVGYSRKEDDSTINYFESWTNTAHYLWSDANSGWAEVEAPYAIQLAKIPLVYGWRPEAIYAGLTNIVSEIEFTLSRNSDVIAYNAAPVLEVRGDVDRLEDKGETRRVWRVTGDNGGIRYVSWEQAIAAIEFQVDQLMKFFWAQLQMPDLSFESIKGLGNVSGEARKTLLTDAHLKVGDEKGVFIEFFDRECNIIKAYLKEMNTKWAKAIDGLEVEHVITPFIQNDEAAEIDKLTKANGGKAVLSQLDSIKQLGWSTDPKGTLDQIQAEDRETAKNNATTDLFP